jgi:CRISPR-associated protein Csb2
MLVIKVRFLHGSLRASGDGDLALMGESASAGEWPPSPSRLFSALVAGGGTGRSRRVAGDDSELRALEEAAPPLILADKSDKGSVQNYPARISTLVRPGTRQLPRDATVTYVWPELELEPRELEVLRRRAARVGYLGCSDSPVHLRVQAELEDDADLDATAWTPSEGGSSPISVPFPGLLNVLDARYESYCEGGSPVGSQQARVFARYISPGSAVAPEMEPARPVRIWAALDRSLPGQRVVAIAEALKGKVLSAFGEGMAPAVLHGHGLEEGAARARFLALPFVGHDRANGRVFGALVELPADVDVAVADTVRSAMTSGELRVGGSARVLSAVDVSSPASAQPATWERASTEWESVFPVVLDRFTKGGLSLADVQRLCRNAGVPEPVEFEASQTSWVRGAVSLKPWQTVRGASHALPYLHLRLRFDEPVEGPFALGRMRSYGLGLMRAAGRPNSLVRNGGAA